MEGSWLESAAAGWCLLAVARKRLCFPPVISEPSSNLTNDFCLCFPSEHQIMKSGQAPGADTIPMATTRGQPGPGRCLVLVLVLGLSNGQISHLSCKRFLLHLLAAAGTFSTSIMSQENNGAGAASLMKPQCHRSPERLRAASPHPAPPPTPSSSASPGGGSVYLWQSAAGVCPKVSQSRQPALPLQLIAV